MIVGLGTKKVFLLLIEILGLESTETRLNVHLVFGTQYSFKLTLTLVQS